MVKRVRASIGKHTGSDTQPNSVAAKKEIFLTMTHSLIYSSVQKEVLGGKPQSQHPEAQKSRPTYRVTILGYKVSLKSLLGLSC